MSGVFQNIDPPTPLHPANMSLPRTKGGGVHHTRREVREWEVNILEDARHWIGLLQYNLSAIQSIELGQPTSRAFFFPLDHRGYEILYEAPFPLPRPSQLRCFLFDLQIYVKSTKYLHMKSTELCLASSKILTPQPLSP